MSAWPGKYVIGLTGNIATGKSVVRKMLEHLGAYGIDADALAHRAITPDAPGYLPVVETFGKWILERDGQIDRAKLGRVVFADREAMSHLEKIVHPLVGQAVDILIRRSRQKVIVIEAIKLLESNLGDQCDSIWVTQARQEVQMNRLMRKREMGAASARQRIAAQPAQEKKVSAADVVIHNNGSFEDTWQQVASAWQRIFPATREEPEQEEASVEGKIEVQRARPSQAADIASLITRLSAGRRKMNRDDVMEAFGEKAFLILTKKGKSIGIAGWKVENLVARTDDVYLEANLSRQEALAALMEEVESASRDLQCEISLLFLPKNLDRQDEISRHIGYQKRTVQSLGIRAWQEAAIESMPPGTVMLFKQLREDRVLRPV
jgi:dephospho-CoA kinase